MRKCKSVDSNYPGDNSRSSSDLFKRSTSAFIQPIIHQKRVITSRDEDIWFVKALDANFVPNRNRSAKIEKLEEKHREKFENQLKELDAKLKSVVEDSNNALKFLSVTVQGELEMNYNSIINIETSIVEPFTDISTLQFGDAFTNLMKLKNYRDYQIEQFRDELKLETKIQLNNVKKVVVENYIKVRKLGFIPAQQIHAQFEHSIMEIHKIILSNFRTYAQVQLHVELIGDQLINKVKHQLELKQEKWFKKTQTSRLKSMFSSAELLATKMNDVYSKSHLRPIEFWNSFMNELAILPTVCNKNNDREALSLLTTTTLEKNQSGSFKQTLATIEDCVKQTTMKFTQAVKHLEAGYRKDLATIDAKYPEMRHANKLQLIKIIGVSEAEKILNKYIEEDKRVQSEWKGVIDEVESSLSDTMSIFNDAFEVRDRHTARKEQAKRFFLDLHLQNVRKNAEGESLTEMKLNLLVDQLRQATTEEKLDHLFNEVVQLLDSMKNGYETKYSNEVDLLKQYMQIAETEAEVFIGEIRTFLAKHPRNSIVDTYKIVPRREDGQFTMEDIYNEKCTNSDDMRLCYLNLSGVSNWTLGLWEGMNIIKQTAVETAIQEATSWIRKVIHTFKNNYEWKLQMHLARYKRIKTEIKDVRATEVKLHKERLQSHILAVHRELRDIENDIKHMYSKQDSIVEEMKLKISELVKKLEECQESVFAKTLVTEIENTQKDTEAILKHLHEDCRVNLENKLKWLRQSSVTFLSSLLMFSEGGNYNWEETKFIGNEIVNLAKSLDKSENVLMNLLQKEIPDKLAQYSVDSESLKIFERKLILKRQIEKEFALLSNKLRSATYDLKLEGKLLKEAAENCMFNNDTEQFKDLLDDVIIKITTRMNNLTFPEATEKLEFCHIDIETESTVNTEKETGGKSKKETKSESEKSEKKQTAKKEKPKESIVFKDVKKQLYFHTNSDELTETKDNYLSVTKDAISKRLGVLQDLLKEIATIDASKVDDPSPVIQEYEETLGTFLNDLKSYNLQCEEVWLTEVVDFLQLVIVLQLQCSEFIDLEIDEIYRKKLTKIEEYEKTYNKEFEDFVIEGNRLRQSVEIKLKPLLGAPSLRSLLDEINSLAGSTNCDLVKECLKRLKTFKESLKKSKVDYRAIMSSKSEYFQSILDVVFNPELIKKLITNLLTVSLPPPSVSRKGSTSSVQSDDENTTETDRPEINPQEQYLAYMVNRMQDKLSHFGVPKHTFDLSNSSPVDTLGDDVTFNLSPLPLSEMVASIEKMFLEKIDETAKQAVVKKDIFLADAKGWIRNWCVNVKKVKKLYAHKIK